MPELPEVETTRRSLLPHLVGRRVLDVRVRDARLRYPIDATQLSVRLAGKQVVDVRRRAKYLLVDFDGGTVMLCHLGMTGWLGVVGDGDPYQKHDHVVLQLDNATQLRFNDARRFGWVEVLNRDQEPTHPRLRTLGVEPLGPDLDPQRLRAQAAGSVRPIKTYIMDAARIVGVGNIYACEALFLARIDPRRRAGSLALARWRILVDAIQATLRDALAQGGTTLRDFADADGRSGYFAVRLRVYGKGGEPCTACGRTIRVVRLGGRSTFFCGSCQR